MTNPAMEQRIAVILPELQAWADRLAEFDTQMDAVYSLFGAQPDSPLLEAINRVEDAYTRLKAEQVGDTGCVWLHWWRWECDRAGTRCRPVWRASRCARSAR